MESEKVKIMTGGAAWRAGTQRATREDPLTAHHFHVPAPQLTPAAHHTAARIRKSVAHWNEPRARDP